MADVTNTVESYLAEIEADWRPLDRGQWGITFAAGIAGDWPLEVGLRAAGDLLQVQAYAVAFDEAFDPWLFLNWNRQTRLVRFATTRSGDLWIQADLPLKVVDAPMLDRLLGLVVEGVQVGRRYAADARSR